MIKAFLFDLDGTLVNTRTANLSAYREACQLVGVYYDDALLSEHVGRLSWKKMLNLCAPGISAEQAARVAQAKRDLYPKFFDQVSVNLGLVSLAKTFAQTVKIALVTSASRQSAISVLEAKNLISLFEVIITGDECTQHKPHPQPYQIAAEKLGVGPEECLVFEDTDIGVGSARTFGAQVVAVQWM